jgi:hypothetical protein
LSESIETFSHGTVFPGNLDKIGACLNEQMAIVAKTPHEAEDILHLEPEEFPVFMLDNAHVAGAGTVEIVR